MYLMNRIIQKSLFSLLGNASGSRNSKIWRLKVDIIILISQLIYNVTIKLVHCTVTVYFTSIYSDLHQGVRIVLLHGDITTLEVDAIVNSADQGSGTS